MARKQTVVPESALMEAFEQGRLSAWDSAYEGGYENGFAAGQASMAYGDDYAQGRADAAESIALWLDTLPQEVFNQLHPFLVRTLMYALSDRAPF